MKPSKVKYIRWAYTGVMLLFLLILYIIDKSGYYKLVLPMTFGIGITAVVMAMIELAFWRCTYCGAYLGRAFNPQYCHKCGRELE
ncbi:MAG: hypothetical protein IKU54_03790 [Oscillospiraceae bacterium]|nr:hypothetical protein [Oscillospiraceae bacterium]